MRVETWSRVALLLWQCGAGSVKEARNSYAYRGQVLCKKHSEWQSRVSKGWFKAKMQTTPSRGLPFQGARAKHNMLHNKSHLSALICNVVSFEAVFGWQIIEKRDRRHEHS